ncbi:MAG TPA: glycosyltransferase family 4 protein, partial [Syntrophales bacterium]
KTRILFVIDGIEFGGGERGFAQIVNGLPESRYETFLASCPQETFYQVVSHSPVQRYPVDFSNRCNPSVLIDLIRIIRNDRIDIVHGQGARADFYARLASGFSRKTMYVSTVQMPVEGYDVGPMKMLLYRAFDRFSERFVDRFLVVSSVLAQAMIQGHGIPQEKVVKIYNGIETDYYKPHDQEEGRRRVRQEYSVKDSEILIGSLGRLVWQKGFEYFIHAMPILIRDIPEAKFFIVGEGPLRQELERQARSLGIQDRLVFTGHRSDIRDIMAAMYVVVIPSLLEGFPMITLEAMAMEKPIVTTAIDGIMEQITDGREGLLIAPKSPPALAQAVKRLVDDPDYARSLGINAREKVVRDFSVRKMIAETIKVYETL